MRKIISISIPCRNEDGNVEPMANEVVKQMNKLPQYDFEMIFIDNCSTDGTQDALRAICANDKRIKAILNAKNFPMGSGLHSIFQASGDCVIALPADFQVPVELIPKVISEWEKGASVVVLLKRNSKTDKIRWIRKIYYTMVKRLSDNDTLSGFTGAGLYDRAFLDMCKSRNDPLLAIQYMVTQYAAPLVKITYNEQPRRSGKSNHSISHLINVAIRRFVSLSDVFPRYAILSGLGMGVLSLFVSIYYFVRKMLDWHNFPLGTAPLIIGVFFLGAIQLIFLGLIGEYVLMINERQKNKPRVIEKERINFDETSDISDEH